MKKLRFHLAFHFNDEEIESISNDYDEWFTNEISQGKSEEQICRALGSPRKVVSDLLSESAKGAFQLRIVLQNTVTQIILTIAAYIRISVSLLKIHNENGTSFLHSGFVMILACFVIGVIAIKNGSNAGNGINRKVFYGTNIALSCFAVDIILFEVLVIPQLTYFNVGLILYWSAVALVVCLLVINLVYVIKELSSDKALAFLLTLHCLGISTLLLYFTNQQHMLYDNWSQHTYFVCGTICLYVETAVLCFATKCIGASEKWIHN